MGIRNPACRFAPYIAMLLVGLALIVPPPDFFRLSRFTMGFWLVAALLLWYFAICRVFPKARGWDGLIVVMMVMSLILRVYYGALTPAWERQHDIGMAAGGADSIRFGHAYYILHYTEHWTPVRESFWQFHHPPLFHFLSGKILNLPLALGRGTDAAFESLQLFGVGVSGMILVVCLRLFKRLGLSGGTLATAMALICFHPSLILLSGSLNNDNLMLFFVLAAALLTLQWYDTPSWGNTLLLAAAIGLGMMTKLSAFQIALVTAVFMLRKLYDVCKSKTASTLLPKYFMFFGVCVPLGLWHPLYLWQTFGLPLGYVPPSGEIHYTGDYSIVQRLLSFPLSLPYCVVDPNEDHSLWAYIAKCSVFGEYSYEGVSAAFASTLVIVNIALMVLSLAAMIYAIRKQGTDGSAAWFLCGIWAVQVAFYVYFNLTVPYVPTMDYRYLVPTLITGAGCLGLAGRQLKEHKPKLWPSIRLPAGILVAVFCGMSCVFWLSIS